MGEISISFIIPIYNTDKYIKKCVLSIVNNYSLIDYEIILVNDGSTDNSAFICDNLSKEYENIRTIHIKNAGVSNARNVGIRESKGKWISFIDSDDFIECELDILSKFLHNQEIELIHYGWKYIGATVKQYSVSDRTEILTCEELFKRKIFHGYVWSYLFKKEIILKNNILFSTDMKYAEDWEFIFKYYSFLNNKVVLLDKYIYNQIYREGSATNLKLGERYICDNFKMYEKVLSLQTKRNLRECIKYHLYSINIWMVNNVIYNNYDILISIYRNSVNKLFKSNIKFTLSPLFIIPILSQNKLLYLWCISLYRKLTKRL